MATFFIHQKITVFANQYRIYEADGDKPGKLIAFAHQKRIALKEKFIFFTDESMQTVAFQLQARKVIDLASAYDVQDAAGTTVGIIKKAFKASLLRSTWHVCSTAGETPRVIARERSVPLAVIRRIWEIAPYIGDLPFFLKYHFDFFDASSDKVVGGYTKVSLIRDHYQLTVDDALLQELDARTFLALGVVMDALQSR